VTEEIEVRVPRKVDARVAEEIDAAGVLVGDQRLDFAQIDRADRHFA